MLRLRHPHPLSDDPVAGLGWRQRRAWRRTERAIVWSHQAELMASLRALIDLPVEDLTTGPAGLLSLTLPGWTVGLAETGTGARHALVSLACQPCHLARAGRYGPFWWLEVAGDAGPPASRAVVLGRQVRLHRRAGGSDHLSPPGLTPLGNKKEYSRS
jgi:hypothetical protein